MILYADTSALVKRYILESGSLEIASVFEKAEFIGTSILTKIEMASAISKAVKMDWLHTDEAEKAWHSFQTEWPAFTRLTVSPPLIERAARLALDHGLRGYDAAHLAASVSWQESLETPITMATYDRELWETSKKIGLSVWPEIL
jgi:predicted nucleic acid-binding protein